VKTSLKTGQKEEILDEDAMSLTGNGKGRRGIEEGSCLMAFTF